MSPSASSSPPTTNAANGRPFGFVRHADEQGRTSGTPGAPARSPSLFKEQLTWFAEDVIPAFKRA